MISRHRRWRMRHALLIFGVLTWLWASPSAAQVSCVPNDTTLCLQGARFQVSVAWTDPQGNQGLGHVVPYTTDDSGIYWFFDASDWEMVVKVIDGCALNGSYWVFAAATTNVAYQLHVKDTSTGTVRTYGNPQGVSSPAVTDTSAFSTCRSGGHRRAPLERSLPAGMHGDRRPLDRQGSTTDIGPCIAGSTRSCLIDGRFSLEVTWTDGAGESGEGQVVPFATDNSSLIWFFSPANWEMMVKIVDGCQLNNRFWVLSAALTNVHYTLTVTDTFSGAVQTYSQANGVTSPAVLDTNAFSGCGDLGPPEVQFSSGASLTFSGPGQSARVAAQVTSAAGSPVPNASVTWTSSSPELVSVQADGPLSAIVTAKGTGPGSSLISASYQGSVGNATALVVATAPTTVIVTRDVIRRMSPGSLTLSRTPATETLKSGQILVSGDDSGVLAQVQTATLSSDEVELQVTPASLDQAFDAFAVDLATQPAQLRATFNRGRATLTLRSGSGKLISAETVGGAQCSVNGGPQVDLTLSSAHVNFVENIRPFVRTSKSNHALQHFEVGLQGTARLTVDTGGIQFNSQLAGTVECIIPLPARHKELTLALPVGVLWLDFNLMPTMGIDASATFQGPSLTIGGPVGILQGTLEAGISYDQSSGWSSFSNRDWGGTLGQSPPSFSDGSFTSMVMPFGRVGVSLAASLGNPMRPGLSISIANVQFAGLEAFGYGTFSLASPLDPSDPEYSGPSWELGVGATGSLMADLTGGLFYQLLKAVGIKSSFAGPLDLFDLKYQLGQSPTVTVAAQESEVAPGNPVTLSSTANPSVSGTVEIWSLPAGASSFGEVAQGQLAAGEGETDWTPSTSDLGTQLLRALVRSDSISAVFPYPSSNTVEVDVVGGPPSIDGTTPDPVPAVAGGQLVSILGNNFQQGSMVSLANITAGSGPSAVVPSWLDSGILQVSFAFGAANSVWSVQVTAPDGTSSNVYYFIIGVSCAGAGDSVLQTFAVPIQQWFANLVNFVHVVDDPCGQAALNGTFYSQGPEGGAYWPDLPVECNGVWSSTKYATNQTITDTCKHDFPPYPTNDTCTTYLQDVYDYANGSGTFTGTSTTFSPSGMLLYTDVYTESLELTTGAFSASVTGSGTLPFTYVITNPDGSQQTCMGQYFQMITASLTAPKTLSVSSMCSRAPSCQGN
jgi:hypothetical protein